MSTTTAPSAATCDPAQVQIWNYWFAHRAAGGAGAGREAGVASLDDDALVADPYADDYRLDHELWFVGSAATDAELRGHFADLVERGVAGELAGWAATPRGALALVLVLDHVARAIHRGTPRAYAGAVAAREVARDAVARGLTRHLAPVEALFFHLTLAQAEERGDVLQALDGIERLIPRCARAQQRLARSWWIGARKHLDLVERFGRDPRRNAALGRSSTAAEEAFLARPEHTEMFGRLRASRDAARAAPRDAPAAVVPAASTRPRLRILALHGFTQNGESFRARARKLRLAVDDLAELTFVSAPHAYAPRGEARAAALDAFGAVPDHALQRAWWQASDDHRTYDGLDASMAFLEQVVRTQGPFDGVLGFSQGGALAAVLAAMQPHPVLSFRFAICISAFRSRADVHADLLRPGSVALPALHILGLGDLLVTPDRSLELFEAFAPATATLVKHGGGHFVPAAWPYPAIRDFLARFEGGITTTPAAVAAATATASDALLQLAREALATSPIDAGVVRRVVDELATAQRWKELQVMVVQAHALRAERSDDELAALVAVHDDIVARFAGQLRRDLRVAAARHAASDASERTLRLLPLVASAIAEGDGADGGEVAPSPCAGLTPRIGTSLDRTTRLGKDIARALFPRADMLAFIAAQDARKAGVAGEATASPASAPRRPAPQRLDRDTQVKNLAYQRYGQVLSLLGGILAELDPARAAQRLLALRQGRGFTPKLIATLQDQPISHQIAEPEPEPVVPCTLAQLTPLLEHLRSDATVAAQTAFDKGTLTTDGRLDLCKQVVGPDGIRPLLDALMHTTQVKRLLLGNNIVGDGGAAAIAGFLRERTDSPLECWYIAGNQIGPAGIPHVCDALADDTRVTALWLKRNPLKPAGMVSIAGLLRANRTLEVLDLVNCGLLDDGLATVLGALMGPGANTTLRHLYVGTNGVTARSAPLIAEFLSGPCVLESLFLSCNRLGDDGVATIARGLSGNRTLRRLSLASNRIGPAGAAALAAALVEHPTLEYLDLGFTKATNDVGELGNFVGDDGARALAGMLERNRALRVLDLLHNFVSQAGVNALVDALEVNQTLTSLQLTQFGRVHNEAGREAVRSALARNRDRLPPDEAERIGKLELPDHITEIFSVYRTKS